MGRVCNASFNKAEKACEGWPVVSWWQVLPACYDEMVLRPVRSSSTIATEYYESSIGELLTKTRFVTTLLFWHCSEKSTHYYHYLKGGATLVCGLRKVESR